MTILALLPQNIPFLFNVCAYRRWREGTSTWLAVTDGLGRHWRVKERS